MRFLRCCVLGLVVGSSTAHADPKEDLVKAVVDQCKVAPDKAQSMATPGRTGTIVQFTLCVSSPVDVGDGCKVVCKKPGSNIGG